ncbi:MAG: hypothetical protein E7316_06805 [Clostridiales bacterium]|nr:hypothetical protein [Clostridiales bacterium]
MERFLRYSLEKQRPIRLIFYTDEGKMKQVNAQVTAMTETSVAFTCLRPKGTFEMEKSRLLSADYKRGDEGQD